MRVLVTGANGQLGWEMKKQSSEQSLEVIALEKKKLDITNLRQLRRIIKKYNPDILVNTAAYTSVDLAEKNKKEAYEVNHHAVKYLAEICKENSIFLIHVSTDYVFDGQKVEPYLETDEASPINTYGLSKKKGEEEIRGILSQHIILRTSWVFGVHGNNFIKTILSLIKTEEEISIVDDQFGCPTSARSIAECIYSICKEYSKTKEVEYGTFHFTNSPSTSWYLFAKDIAALAYKNQLINGLKDIKAISHKYYKSKAERPINSSMSSEKIINSYKIINSKWTRELEYIMSKLPK